MMRDVIGYWMGKNASLSVFFFISLPAAKPGMLYLNQSSHNNKSPKVSVLSLDIMDHTPVL